MSKLIKLSLLCLLLKMLHNTHASSFNKSDILIISILNETNVGEQSQVLGTEMFLQNKIQSNKIVHFQDNEIDKINKFLIQNAVNKKIILISGEKGSSLINKLDKKINLQNTIVALSSHQLIRNYQSFIASINIWAMPNYIFEKNFANSNSANNVGQTVLLPIIGVPHNVSNQTLNQEYNKYQTRFKDIKNEFIVVILGGDAPTENNVMRYYDANEATKLANFLGDESKKRALDIIIFNGPRTGKHLNGNIDEAAHKFKLDHVTQAFYNALKAKVDENRIKLFDFQYGEPSLYKAGLGFALIKGMKVFVPGESTSMVSEVVDNFTNTQVIVVKNNAMSAAHNEHIDSIVKDNETTILDYDKNLMENSNISKYIQHKTAAEVYAEKIYKLLMSQAD